MLLEARAPGEGVSGLDRHSAGRLRFGQVLGCVGPSAHASSKLVRPSVRAAAQPSAQSSSFQGAAGLSGQASESGARKPCEAAVWPCAPPSLLSPSEKGLPLLRGFTLLFWACSARIFTPVSFLVSLPTGHPHFRSDRVKSSAVSPLPCLDAALPTHRGRGCLPCQGSRLGRGALTDVLHEKVPQELLGNVL